MQPTYSNYVLFAYGTPFFIFAVLFVFMSIVNKRAHSFMIEVILGIKLKSNRKNSRSMPIHLEERVDKFLYVEPDKRKEALPCVLRFLCDLFSSGILAVLIEIIFEKCVLEDKLLVVGDPCPDFKADCFGTYNGTPNFGPFQCTPSQNSTFPVTSADVICYAWVYNDVSTWDVLETTGISAGLLGLIACIIPLVYYISYYKKRFWWMSIICLILPLGTIGVFIAVIIATYPQPVSVLTIITFSILIAMTSVGWIWAFFSSYYWRLEHNDAKCCCAESDRCKKCCSHLSWCLKPYQNYPCCCLKEDGKQRSAEQSKVHPVTIQPKNEW
jgi:hypothetical protein